MSSGWPSARAKIAELRAAPRLAVAVPPHQPAAAAGAALALHGRRRAGVSDDDRVGRLPRRRGSCSGWRRCRCCGGCCARCRRRPGGGRFPGVRLLLGLTDPEKMPERTPWWLLLLRMTALAAAILAFSGPVLNPRPEGSERAAPGAARRRLGRCAGLGAADGPGGGGARRGGAERPAGGGGDDGGGADRRARRCRGGPAASGRERLAGLAPYRLGAGPGRLGRLDRGPGRAVRDAVARATASATAARRRWRRRCSGTGR